MKKLSKRTPKPSEAALLVQTINALLAELSASRKVTEKVIELAREKDAQLKIVIESKFQNYVSMYPERVREQKEPESIDHLADVTEVSTDAAEEEMIASTTRQRKADTNLERALIEEFAAIAAEHTEAHQEAQA